MMCRNHPQSPAVTSCSGCGSPLCAECAVALDDGPWCTECLSTAVAALEIRRRRRQSALAAALLSLIPGAGHMYLGLIGKGFALMGILFASIFLIILYSAVTGMYWMTAYLVPTLIVLFVSYALFDSLSAIDAIRSGKDPHGNDDELMRFVWEHIFLNGRFSGYVLLVAGIMGVLELFARPLSIYFHDAVGAELSVPAIAIPVVLLILGIVLIRRSARRR
ncbi:MAG TPA: B-box zinc finger protein [Spirochaetia bacterium]|nr:B-box zinc finger protein [Spirochaetia bacterium]